MYINSFTTVKELLKLTKLRHEQHLWDIGFDLDDWDIGFCTKKQLTNDNCSWLYNQMENYCMGFKEIKYRGNYYYLVYHS